MEKNEYQVIVTKDNDGKKWYTARKRKIHFLWRGFWQDLTPMCQSTYDGAYFLIVKDRNRIDVIN